jgi:predicted nucleic acid-binding Zn ribbon protein
MEVMQKISDKPLARHAKCGGKLTKEWSRTGFQFKGSGWYVTDYAGKKADAKEGGESKESKPEAASETKPAAETKAAESKPEAKAKGGKKTAGAPTGGGD